VATNPAIIAHDARNALAAIQGRLQLIRRRTTSGSYDQARALLDVDLALERLRLLSELVDELTTTAQRCVNAIQDRRDPAWIGEDADQAALDRSHATAAERTGRERNGGGGC
jgi:hypothetical protein